MDKQIKSVLISVFHKEGLENIIKELTAQGITIYSTGGTQKYIEDAGGKVEAVEDLTGYPSILGGRVKTLHPKVFGGILSESSKDHLEQIAQYEIPKIDAVVVDLYPFEDTLKNTKEHKTIIEKIDIGGISLIRAAAKNYEHVVVIPSKEQYADLLEILQNQKGQSTLSQRRRLAATAFNISSHYDTAIFNYINEGEDSQSLKVSSNQSKQLRYGENPHQNGFFFGDLDQKFDKISGKELSYNNLVDVDAAAELMAELKDTKPSFAILKHTNACGIASRDTVLDAWHAALAGDPVSAFGGILISNTEIDLATAEEINKIFYEVLIAPSFSAEATELLTKKKKRVLLKIKDWSVPKTRVKTALNGFISQDNDTFAHDPSQWKTATKVAPKKERLSDLEFANLCVKNLKSNTIVLVRDGQLLGMGCGQTSRVDACNQAIDKALRMGFELEDAVMASDAFFPFPDCVEIAYNAGIKTVIQPGGSIKDQLSIDFCDSKEIAMVFTGVRHFKH